MSKDEDYVMDSSDSSDESPAEMAALAKGLNIEIEKSDSDDDSSDSDSEEREEIKEVDEDAVLERLSAIDSKLLLEPFSYDLYVEKVGLYKSIGDLDELRKAREKLSELYPLSAALWLEWILDEQKLSATDEEKEGIINLFERATKDYLSIELWFEYTKFNLSEEMGKEGGHEKCRILFEKALASCGLHVAFGSLIWESYKDFEAALLGIVDDEDEMKIQENRFLTICRRQLSVPLLDMEKTYQQISEKIDLDEPTRNGYQTALNKLKEIEPRERKLLKCFNDEEKIAIYKEYIEFEKSGKANPARIICLYERAVADHPLDGSLWSEYIDYVVQRLQINDSILDVSQRASRNCPWVLDIWIKYIKCLEMLTEGNEKVKTAFENSLLYCSTGEQAGTMWLKYIESLRRRINTASPNEKDIQILRNTFDAAENHLLQLLEEPNDYICQILMFQARFEAHNAKNMEKSRELWEEIFKRGYAGQFRVWNQYIMLERQYGDTETVRRKLSQAMTKVKDDLPSITDLWLNLERDFGDKKSMESCELKISKQMEKYYATAAESSYSYSHASGQDNEHNWKSWKNEKNNVGASKRKFTDNESAPLNRAERRKQAHQSDNKFAKKFKPTTDVTDGSKNFKEPEFKRPSLLPKSKTDNDAKKEDSKEDRMFDQERKEVKHDPSMDNQTVFLSNLTFTTDRDDIRQFFQDIGKVKDIRLVENFKGQSKGYAYVVFDTVEEAQKALTKDRAPLNKRPAFVSKCDPDKSTRRTQFKYPASLEKNKLFVKGLPFSVTNEDLKTLFGQYGALKDVRLVTLRNGYSKGLAYVDFEDEAGASLALLKTDGMTLEDKVLSVAISNPPSKSIVNEFLTPSQIAVPVRRKIGTFVPRSVQVSAAAASTSKSSDDKDNAPKSNQQFRELFAKK